LNYRLNYGLYWIDNDIYIGPVHASLNEEIMHLSSQLSSHFESLIYYLTIRFKGLVHPKI